MVWSTAGTNRVCSRCMALKDTVVGYTDESGVTISPIHPRCRCTIIYNEVAAPKPLTSPNANGNVTGEIKPLTPERIRELRAADLEVLNSTTGANFGFKNATGSPDWSKEIMLANGDGKGLERMMNCQRCVVAHEARMRGYDVIARPSWGDEDTLRSSGQWLSAFDYNRGSFKLCTGKTGDEVIKSATEIMRSFGEGARAISAEKKAW